MNDSKTSELAFERRNITLNGHTFDAIVVELADANDYTGYTRADDDMIKVRRGVVDLDGPDWLLGDRVVCLCDPDNVYMLHDDREEPSRGIILKTEEPSTGE